MVDFHLHTYYSDGTLSPKALVQRAKEQGVTTLAITDHDGVKGVKEAVEAGEKLGVRVIAGIEFSAAIEEENLFDRQAVEGQEIYMHILGYGIDINNEPLNLAIHHIQQKRKERNEEMQKALYALGYELKEEDFRIYPTQEYIGKPNFARALVKRGYACSVKEAFEKGKFLRRPEIRKIHRAKIDAKEAIALIIGAGGIPVLAHPMKITYKEKNEEGSFFDKLEPLLIKLKEYGLMGMECYYSSHLIYETQRLLEIADRLDLLISAGTDFHGPELNDTLEIGKFPLATEKENLSKSLDNL